MVKTSNIYLAELRYYNMDRHSVSVFPEKAYALLEKTDEGYVNLLNRDVDYPVYRRAHREIETRGANGEYVSYGTYIVLDSGEKKDGLCYVVESRNYSDGFLKDIVDYDDIKDYVLKSSLFFYDSIDILKNSFYHRKKAKLMKQKKESFDKMIKDYCGEKAFVKVR